MIEINRILLATDFSASAGRSMNFALDLAVRENARFSLLHVSSTDDSKDLPAEEAADFIRSRLSEKAVSRLTDLSESEPEVINVNYTVLGKTNVVTAILDYAADNDIDLIALGTHGHGRLWHFILGGVAETVAREAACPVVVSRKDKDDGGRHSMQQIVVAIDFSRYSKAVLAQAKQIAELFGSNLDLLFIAEERIVPLFSDTGVPNVTRLRVDPEIADNAADALRQLDKKTQGPNVGTEYVVRSGAPGHEIVEHAAEKQAGLIIMATRGLSDMEQGFLGSVTERVMRTSPCPVWTTKLELD